MLHHCRFVDHATQVFATVNVIGRSWRNVKNELNDTIDIPFLVLYMDRDDPKLPGDSGGVPVSEWSGWRFDSHCETFSLLDMKTSYVSRQPRAHPL